MSLVERAATDGTAFEDSEVIVSVTMNKGLKWQGVLGWVCATRRDEVTHDHANALLKMRQRKNVFSSATYLPTLDTPR